MPHTGTSAFTSCSCAHGHGVRPVLPGAAKDPLATQQEAPAPTSSSIFPVIPPPPPPQQPRTSPSPYASVIASFAAASTSTSARSNQSLHEWASDVAAAAGSHHGSQPLSALAEQHHHSHHHYHAHAPTPPPPVAAAAPTPRSSYPPTSPAKWYDDPAADARVLATASTVSPSSIPPTPTSLKRGLQPDDLDGDDHSSSFDIGEPHPKRRSAPTSPARGARGLPTLALTRTASNPTSASVSAVSAGLAMSSSRSRNFHAYTLTPLSSLHPLHRHHSHPNPDTKHSSTPRSRDAPAAETDTEAR